MNKKEANEFEEKLNERDFMDDVVYDGGSREDAFSNISSEISKLSKKFHEEEDFGGNQVLIPFSGSGNLFKNYVFLHKVRENFPMYSIKHVNGHIIVRLPESEEEQEVLKSEYEAEKAAAIDYMIGLSRVFDVMTEQRKPLIGHNVFLDILYVYQSFCDQLPMSLDTLKHNLLDMFLTIYDTKHIFVNTRKQLPVVSELRSGTNLLKLYQTFNSEDFQNSFTSTPPIEVSSHENLVSK